MKKLVSLALVFVFLFTSFVSVQVMAAEDAVSIWNGEVAAGFESGSGTKKDPYIIKTAEQLAYFGKHSAELGYIYVSLEADIFLNDPDSIGNAGHFNTPNGNIWTPIKSFNGAFYGNEHTISGIYCKDITDAGLFASITGSVIKDLGIINSVILTNGEEGYAGAVTAKAKNTDFTNCYCKASAISGDISGGIAGYAETSNFTRCYNESTVNGNGAGGIIGYCEDTVSDIYSQVTASYNAGAITAEITAGGLIGIYEAYNLDLSYCFPVRNSFNCGDIYGKELAGGIAGEIYSGAGRPKVLVAQINDVYNAGAVDGGQCGYLFGNMGSNTQFNNSYYFYVGNKFLPACGNKDTDPENIFLLSAEDSLKKESYSDFRFDDVWTFEGNADYPYPEIIGNYVRHIHNYNIDIGTEPDCTRSGLYRMLCGCGLIKQHEIPALGHKDDGEWIVSKEPSCTEFGTEYKLCTRCHEVAFERDIPLIDHTPSDWFIEQEPTCTKGGSKVKYCTVCKMEIKRMNLLPSHKPGEWIVVSSPTAEESGERIKICAVCDKVTEREYFDCENHISSDWEVRYKPSCTKNGAMYKYCTECGFVIEEEYIPKLSHKLGEWTVKKDPTCTEKGVKVRICELCNTAVEITDIPTVEHIAGEWTVIKEATCSEKGSEIQKCINCDAECAVRETALKPHTAGKWERSVEDSSKLIRWCLVCNQIAETRDVIVFEPNDKLNIYYKQTSKLKLLNSDGLDIVYKSADPSVAMVDSEGNIIGIGRGNTEVYATIAGTDISVGCKVNVDYAWWQWIIRVLMLGFIWY